MWERVHECENEAGRRAGVSSLTFLSFVATTSIKRQLNNINWQSKEAIKYSKLRKEHYFTQQPRVPTNLKNWLQDKTSNISGLTP